jgi:DNA-binding response OmpR family regulator
MNGIEMLKRIRSTAPTARVVMVSGVDPTRTREALDFCALACGDKPFDLATLKAVVAMVLQDKPSGTAS